MKLADPFALRLKVPRETLVFAAHSRTGKRERQEDVFLNFNDECFVLADGVGTLPHGDVAARLASETAIWGYKLIRQRPYYWDDKKLFMKRIFRTTNMTIWQKRREKEFAQGLATTLMVTMMGPKTFWLGYSGDSAAWHIRGSEIQKLTREAEAFEKIPRGALGLKRFGLVPNYVSGEFRKGDVLVMASDGCSNYLTPQDILMSVLLAGSDTDSVTSAVTALLDAAETNGSVENMSAVLIKRVPVG